MSTLALKPGIQRNVNILVFAVFCIFGMALTILTGLRASESQTKLQSDLGSMNGKLDTSLDSQHIIAQTLRDGMDRIIAGLNFISSDPKSLEQRKSITEIRNGLQTVLATVARQQQEAKIANWPCDIPTPNHPGLCQWFHRNFPDADALNGQERFFLYLILKDRGRLDIYSRDQAEIVLQEWNEMFPNTLPWPSRDSLVHKGFIRDASMGGEILAPKYYSIGRLPIP